VALKLIFMGTPVFAAEALKAVSESPHEVLAVYTQPPRPAGRGRAERKSDVHRLAEQLGLPVRTPTSLKRAEEQVAFADLCTDMGADLGVVVAYGLILPQAVLDAPRLGCVNLHASLLPRWRGAAPIQRAVMAGDELTGVEVMRMEAGLDTGPVLATETARIYPFDTAGTLHDRLAELGADLLVRTLDAIERGEATETPQAEEGVTYAKKIDKAEARIDWTRPAAELDRAIRGLSPFPGAWFELTAGGETRRVKALNSKLEPDAETKGAAPGTVLDDALLVAAGDGAVRLTQLQREGRKPQDAEDFLRGQKVERGAVLG
jgi:methionyl-tRNA formyltransferase